MWINIHSCYFIFTPGAGPLYGGCHVCYSSPDWDKRNTSWVLCQLKAATGSLSCLGVFSCIVKLHHKMSLDSTHWTFNIFKVFFKMSMWNKLRAKKYPYISHSHFDYTSWTKNIQLTNYDKPAQVVQHSHVCVHIVEVVGIGRVGLPLSSWLAADCPGWRYVALVWTHRPRCRNPPPVGRTMNTSMKLSEDWQV